MPSSVVLVHRQIHLFMMWPNGRCFGCQTTCAICKALPVNTLNKKGTKQMNITKRRVAFVAALVVSVLAIVTVCTED